MVCNRCIKVVSTILCDLQIDHSTILLGEAPIKEPLSDQKKAQLEQALLAEGFELIDDKKTRIIERIKRLIIERVSKDLEETHDNLSDFLTTHLHLDYPYLSGLFSSIEG